MRVIAEGRPVIVGEVLFDTLPSGEAMLGGAPFNVAWHLKGFGLDPLFISKVGEDCNGERILTIMEKWGMDLKGVKMDSNHATGRVEVELDESKNPTYHIMPNRAYDYISGTAALAELDNIECSLLYHGTLIRRVSPSDNSMPVSRQALELLRKETGLPIFVSLNLRPPWWDYDSVSQLLKEATWCKLNEPELAAINRRSTISPAEREDAAHAVLEQYDLEIVMVTLGTEGAFFVLEGGEVVPGRPRIVPTVVDTIESEKILVDTIGAGDAFAAVALLGLSCGWPVKTILQRAIDFSSDLCSWAGATPRSKALYVSYLQRWGQDDIAGNQSLKYPEY